MQRLKKKFPARVLLTTLFAVIFALSVAAGTFYAVTVNGTPLFPSSGKGNVAAIGAAVDAAESGDGDYTITVNTAFESGVASQTQKIEYFADGNTDTAADYETLGANGTKVFTAHASDTTPTLNLKNSANARISGVVIKNAVDSDITASAFGGQIYYDNFIESCKTSLFGYIELQNITGNITVDVTYDTPVTYDMLGTNTNNNDSWIDRDHAHYYSVTVVAKGDVVKNNIYQSVIVGPGRYPYNMETGLPESYVFKQTSTNTSELHYTNGFQTTHYCYCNPQDLDIKSNSNSYIESVKLYDNATGSLIQSEFDAAGKGSSNEHVVYTLPDNDNRRNITYVITYRDNDYVAPETSASAYSITVNSHYESAVDNDASRQNIEIYDDTTEPAIARALNGVSADMPEGNTTPTLNLKSNAKVSVKSVIVTDADGNDVTADAFGATQYYTDFIESCKTSLFGYLELQNITGNITVDVTYDEPIADKSMGNYNSNLPYYSTTVITKGDVGPYGKAFQNDYEYQDVSFGSCYTTFNVGDAAPSGSGSNRVYNPSGHYTMRDGGQITRYSYGSLTSYFDYSYYSYISDIKMYYNDTGEEVKTLNLAGEAYTTSRYNSYSGDSAARSVTYVVTYKAFDSTTIYANIQTLQAKAGNYKIRLDADEGGRFAEENNYNISNSNTVKNDLDENINPFNSTSRSYNKVKAINSDSVKFYFDNEQGNSIDFRHFKVYSLDVNGNTFGDQIAGEGCDNPLLTLTYSPARDSWDDDGWVTISGLRNYDGDIYVTADTYRYNHKVSIRQSGEHTDSFTITADDAFGAISGAGQGGDADKMLSSCTKTADEESTEHWMYSGGQYTVKSSGDQQIQKVTLYYYQFTEGSTSHPQKTVTYDTKNADGSISFTFPTDSYYSQTTSNCYLTVYYEPITTYETQIYPMSSGGVINDYYSNNSTGNSNHLVELSVFDGNTEACRIFNTASDVTTAYQTLDYNYFTSNNTSRIYKIPAGTTVKVKNIFTVEQRAVSTNRPQGLIDFVNRAMEFKDIKIYEASNFKHNSNGDATVGVEISVTRDGDYYVFTMPESGVRIVPEYECHQRSVNILSSERDANGKNYSITKGTLGTASLTGENDDDWFISYAWNYLNDSYLNNYPSYNYAKTSWTTGCNITTDGSSYVLTATPTDSANYTVKSVKAYKYNYASGIARNNKMNNTNYNDASYNWLTYDSEGNITNEEITGIVGALGDPDANGARSCTITLPDTLDVGNIVLWVEFAPKETTTFAHFKYEPDTTSEKPFNPIVNLKGVFTGDYASLSATDGEDVEAAVFDEDNAQYLNLELGGTNQFRSGFYQYNLIYTIKDYTSDTTLAKFRVYRDQIYPIDCTEEELNEYLVTSACTFEEVSGTDGVCEKATLRFKLPENGLTLSYQSERLYIPVTVKQYVKDSNGDYQPANNDLTATLTKYFDNTSGLSDFAQNKYFAKDSTLTSSYGLNTAESSAFADTVTVTGAEETHYMLIENLKSWQGFYIMPSTARGYTVSSDGIEQKSYNRLGGANTWDGYMSSDTKTYVEGSGYCVRYHAEYRSDMSLNSSDINSHMGAQSVEIKVYYEETDDLYASVTYTPTGSFKLNTVFKGTIRNDADGVVSGTDGASMSAAVYNGESVDPKTLTMEVGGGNNNSSEIQGSIFHETNLVYTLTDPNSNVPLLKFRIYRGQVEPVEHYTQETFDKYIQSASVEGYNTDTYSALREKATVRFKVPEGGMSITYTAETPYIPVTVKQYVLDSEGSATAAGESFTAAVTKYYPGSNEFGKYKFFAEDNTLTDSYGLSAASQDDFVNDYTVTGAGDTHYMVYLNEYSGLYVMPNAPTGYALATIRAKALNSAGADVATGYKQNLVDVPTAYNATNGYEIGYNGNSDGYFRGATIEVDVYYQPTTSVTVKQTMDGVLGTGTLATVAVSNANAEAPVSPYKAYINPDNSAFADSFTLTDTSANMNGTDEENPSAHIRTTEILTNKGTKPQFVISPKGARSISSVTISKKAGGSYTVLTEDEDYTVSGSASNHGTLTYTFKNAVAIGDDYLVDIVYGNEKTLTVKAYYYDDGNTAQEIDTEYEYNITKLDKITVTGELTGSEDSPFVYNSEGISSFEVTYPGKTVTSFTNAKVTVNTTLKSGSSYVIANVVAYNDAKSDINLVTPQDIKDENGKSLGTSYSECKLSSLTSTDNVTLIVYLAKVADVKVSVYTIGADGVINSDGSTSFPGVPHGEMSDSAVQITNSYVDVHAVDSSNINKNAIITAADEGNYYTGNFDVTFAPYSRDVKVLQGSKLSIFAQIPNDDRGTYVVRKVVSNGTGFRDVSVGDVSTFTDTDGSSNLRVNISTRDEKIDASKTYDIKIYIEKAKTIYTRATDQGGNTETYTGGRVTVFGSNSEAGVLPFTVIKPSNVTAYNSYSAVSTSSSADYTSEAKCVRDTSLRFEAMPQSNYEDSSVTVKKGQTKETATDVAFTSVAGDSGKMTYTITDPMDYTYNIYIDVVFTVAKWGKVTIDYQYSDDFVNFKYLLDPNDGLSTLSVSSYYPKVSIDKVKDGEESFNNKSDITFEGTHTYEVIAGNEFRTSTSTYKNGKWYIPAETYVYDNNADAIRSREGSVSRTNTGMDATVREGDDLTFHIRLVPMSKIGAVLINNNCYNDLPTGVKKEEEGIVTLNAHFDKRDDYTIEPPAALFNYPGCTWGNSTSFIYDSDIVENSVLDTVVVDYNRTATPGNIRKVTIYEFNKGDAPSTMNYNFATADYTKAVRSWDITSHKVNDGNEDYITYNCLDGNDQNIKVKGDMEYRVVVEYDVIKVTERTYNAAYADGYVVFADSIDNIDIDRGSGDIHKLSTRLDESYAAKTQNAYFVIVSKLSPSDYELNATTFYDYQTQTEENILSQMQKVTRSTSGGIARYYYYWRINSTDTYPVDNSMRFYYSFNLKKENPDVPVEENLDCNITVEQWNRDTYDGQYVAADNQSVTFSVPAEAPLKNAQTGISANPLTVTSATDYLYSNKKVKLTVHPEPYTGYNVEKVVIIDGTTGTYHPDSNGNVEHTLYNSNVTVKIYYSRPLLRISATNEGKASKAVVQVYNTTEQTTQTVLDANTFTSGVFATKGDSAQVIIKPITYTSGELTKYYTVASIRVGDTYDNTSTAYTENGGTAQGYSVSKTDDGSEFVLTIDNIQKDKYIFIQLRGDEAVLRSNLQIRQQIRFAGESEYVDCTDGYYGTVITTGTLAGVDYPLNFDETYCASYTLRNAASADGSVLFGTALSLTATPPEGYSVHSVEALMNGDNINVNLSEGVYSLDTTAPNSGTTVITVKYALPTTPYTLNFVYQGRKGGNDGASYEGDDDATDEKTYTVNAELYPSELDETGKPTYKTLADYAPAVEDLYKDCTWTIDEDHVTYGEGSTVTVRAVQDVREYVVKFYYEGHTDEPLEVTQVKLNSLVMPEGAFVEAPESDGSNSFAYWLVQDADSPIDDGNGGTTYKEVAKCFDRQFNLRVTGNYIVTACYGATAKAITISDPAYTREQYTDESGKNVDKLYADFILAYMEDNGLLLNTQSPDAYQTGLIVEYDSSIRLSKEDEPGAKLSSEDKTVYYPDGDKLSNDDAQKLASGKTLSDPAHSYIVYDVANDMYNNHNRVDRAIAFSNTENARHFVLRAYYYVWNKTTDSFEMTEPVYFYLYDIGNSVND